MQFDSIIYSVNINFWVGKLNKNLNTSSIDALAFAIPMVGTCLDACSSAFVLKDLTISNSVNQCYDKCPNNYKL